MKARLLSNPNQRLTGMAVAGAVLFALMYLLTAIPRVLYPYDLDFIEDGIVMTALRLAQNQPIFLAPNAEFAPHVYMPLYPWLGGLLFKAVDPGLVWLRLLSLAAVMVTGGLIYGIARRESGQTWLGLVCAGLFLGGYRINGFWYELARVDSLFVALSLAGLSVGVYGRRAWPGLMGAGILLALAFWTKQTGLILGAGLGVYLLLIRRRQSWPFWLTFGLLTAGPALIVNTRTGGWFLYYTFHIARINPIELERVVNFVTRELLGLMAGLSVMAVGAGWLAWRRAGASAIWQQPWLVCLGLAVLISGLGRASVGGNINNRMLGYTLLCLAPALLMGEWRNQPNLRPRWRSGLISLLVLAQFGLGVYNPLRYIPTPAMRHSGDRLIAEIAAIDGEVLVSMHPYYAWLAGKTPSAQLAALWHARERGSLPLPPDVVARIERRYYAAIISDESLFESEPAWQELLNRYYVPRKSLPPGLAPPTSTGLVVRPKVVYAPQ
jgi:4-amino-4-deoxy-L-arabinose transferase-like glycosyltransferase